MLVAFLKFKGHQRWFLCFSEETTLWLVHCSDSTVFTGQRCFQNHGTKRIWLWSCEHYMYICVMYNTAVSGATSGTWKNNKNVIRTNTHLNKQISLEYVSLDMSASHCTKYWLAGNKSWLASCSAALSGRDDWLPKWQAGWASWEWLQ